MPKLTAEERDIICRALDLRKDEVGKLQKKAEKLGLTDRASDLKRDYIAIGSLRARVNADEN